MTRKLGATGRGAGAVCHRPTTQKGSTMAHAKVQGGRFGQREGENRLAQHARGPRPIAAPGALVVTGLILALAGASRTYGQQPAGAISPYAAVVPAAQPAKPGEPERLGQPRPAGGATLEAPAPRRTDAFRELHPRLFGL